MAGHDRRSKKTWSQETTVPPPTRHIEFGEASISCRENRFRTGRSGCHQTRDRRPTDCAASKPTTSASAESTKKETRGAAPPNSPAGESHQRTD